jgi:hypothetical protein
MISFNKNDSLKLRIQFSEVQKILKTSPSNLIIL